MRVSRPPPPDPFGCRQPPFGPMPDDDALSAGPACGPLLDALVLELRDSDGQGVVTLTGDVGAGKSTLARLAASRCAGRLEVVRLNAPAATPEGLVLQVGQALGLATAGLAPADALRALHQALIGLHLRGRPTLLVVDEAHTLSPDALDAIGCLAALRSRNTILVRLLLVGQAGLATLLALPVLRGLRERVGTRIVLAPLTDAQVQAHLVRRLAQAGVRHDLFEPAAVAALAHGAQGLLRRIELLAGKALCHAVAAGAATVSTVHVAAALRETGLSTPGSRWSAVRRLAGADRDPVAAATLGRRATPASNPGLRQAA